MPRPEPSFDPQISDLPARDRARPDPPLPERLLVRSLEFNERQTSFATDDPYVEACWLPIIGPSSVLCLRRLATDLREHPDGVIVGLGELARDLGLGNGAGRHAPVRRTLERLASFRLARFVDDETLEVRLRVPPVSDRSLARLGRRALELHRQRVPAVSEENPYLQAALDYAGRGWAVLPLRTKDKVPNGALAPHGLHDATSDPARIREWWRRVPTSNVGIRTGEGLDVVDLDSEAARAALEDAAPEPLAPSVLVRSARGWHLWFASSGLPTRAGVVEGVDVRGPGGYVVAPPSVHPSGAVYCFIDPATGAMLDRLPPEALKAAPPWLVSWCRPDPPAPRGERAPIRLNADHYVRAAIEGECAAVARTPEGQRNDRLNRAAFSLGTLVGGGALDEQSARDALLDAARAAGLADIEARRTVASGLRAGTTSPRRLDDVRRTRDERDTPDRHGERPALPSDDEPPSRSKGEAAVAAVLARCDPDAATSYTPITRASEPERGLDR